MNFPLAFDAGKVEDMRCIVDKKEFVGIDQFDTVRIKVSNETVRVYCFGNKGIRQESVYKCDKTEDGTVIFSAKELLGKIKTTKSDSIYFKNNVVSNGKTVFHKMPILQDSEAPDLIGSDMEFEWSIVLPAETFCDALDSVVFCLLTRMDRPVTNNVCMVLSEDTLTSFGFDGYKIAAHKTRLSLGKFISEEIFVHVSLISTIKRWASGKKDIKVCKSKSWVYLISSNSCIAFLQQNVELPDFDKILNFPSANSVSFDKSEIKDILGSLVSTDEGVSFIFKGKVCNLQCYSVDTKASSAAIVDFDSDNPKPINFKLNGRFLLDVIKRMPGTKLRIRLGDKSEDPVTINSKSLRCVIAPMVM